MRRSRYSDATDSGPPAPGPSRISPASIRRLIGYHFGGKPGLYIAVFDRITRRVALYLGPVAQAIEQQLDEIVANSDRQVARCVGFIHQLTDALVATFSAPESAAWARLVLREQQNPSEAFDRLYGGMIGRMLSLISRLIGHVCATDPDAVETRVMTQTVIGQALVFRSARATVLRQLDWQDIGDAEIITIQAVIRRNITAMLIGGRS